MKTTDRLRQIRSQLAAVVLIVEDGEAEVTKESLDDLRMIHDYCSRIARRVDIQETRS